MLKQIIFFEKPKKLSANGNMCLGKFTVSLVDYKYISLLCNGR